MGELAKAAEEGVEILWRVDCDVNGQRIKLTLELPDRDEALRWAAPGTRLVRIERREVIEVREKENTK